MKKHKKASVTIWNSLEITKIIISTITPLAVVGIGYSITRQADRLAADKVISDRKASEFAAIVQKRGKVWDVLGPQMMIVLRRASLLRAEIVARSTYPENLPRYKSYFDALILSDSHELGNSIDKTLSIVSVNQVYFSEGFFLLSNRFIKDARSTQNYAMAFRGYNSAKYASQSYKAEGKVQDDMIDITTYIGEEIGIGNGVDKAPPTITSN